MSAPSLAREYRSALVYQLIMPLVSRSNKPRSFDSLKTLLPTMRISLILALSPSVTLKDKLTRLRSIGVTVMMISAPYKLRLMYCRLSSCSALSANALSNGKPSARPISRSAFFNNSLSNSLAPTKFTSATVGRSSTITTSTSPLTSRRTSLNKPKPNSARIALAPFSSL